MPNTQSAKKRLRQSRRRRLQNRSLRSEIRTRIRRILEMDSADEAREAVSQLYTVLDRASRKGIVHPGTAARQKARVARHVNRLAGD